MFVTSKNPESGLDAVVVLEPDDESPHSVWLYVSNGGEIISDCFLVNLIEPEDSVSEPEYFDAPPPVIRRFLTSSVPSELPDEGDLGFRWAESGKDVAVSIRGTVIGFTVSGERRGYSRAISQTGPWGNPWLDETFTRHFSA